MDQDPFQIINEVDVAGIVRERSTLQQSQNFISSSSFFFSYLYVAVTAMAGE